MAVDLPPSGDVARALAEVPNNDNVDDDDEEKENVKRSGRIAGRKAKAASPAVKEPKSKKGKHEESGLGDSAEEEDEDEESRAAREVEKILGGHDTSLGVEMPSIEDFVSTESK